MSLLAPILFFTLLAVKNTEAAVRPIVTLEPNWNNVYAGDWVTLSCSVGSAEDNYRQYSYTWYKDDTYLGYEKSRTLTAEVTDSRVYTCAVDNGIYSDPVRLYVISNGYLILQTPPDVVEGDSLSLRCYSEQKYNTDPTASFYKDDERLDSTDDILHIPNVTSSDTGRYKCSKYFQDINKRIDAEAFISVQELFTTPNIKTSPGVIREGDDVTLTCDTRLNPLRPGTELQFAFYRDGQTVREFSRSGTFKVQTAQLEDSGTYTCEVRTATDTVRKNSKALSIQIRDLFPTPNIQTSPGVIREGDDVTLTCDSRRNLLRPGTELQFAFYRDGQIVQEFSRSGTFKVQSAQLKDSGSYTCDVRTATDTVRKNSKALSIQIQELFPSPQITVSPLTVDEGERVTLECVTDVKGRSIGLSYMFYKDSQNIQRTYMTRSDYVIDKARVEHTGSYHCSAQSKDGKVRKNSINVPILVQELFTTPNIQTSPGVIREGDDVTLTCDTRLNPLRPRTGLQFAFYRDGGTVREFSVFDTFRVWSAQLKDSGYYTCNVRTATDTVRKNSNALSIQIQEAAVRPIVTLEPNWNNVYAGDRVTLSCSVGSAGVNSHQYSYSWYKDGRSLMNEKSKTLITKVADSGVYKCSVNNGIYSDPVRLHVFSKEAASLPVVTLSPNWSKVYSGDKVTLSCNLVSAEGREYNYYNYDWYKNKNVFKRGKSVEFTANEENSGVYQCYVNRVSSLPVQLDVFSQDYLILQTPPDVIEGDPLSLRCRNGQKYKNDRKTSFYKDDESWDSTDDIFHIPNVTSSETGRYKCSKYFQDIKERIYAKVYISVQDLFPTPNIQTSPDFIREGDDVTLTCVTRLNPLRPGTGLQFAFYKNGRTVREFSVSDTFKVQTAQLEDSGTYTCEVRTVTDTVRKNSNALSIQIQELFPSPQIKVIPSLTVEGGRQVTLECVTVLKGKSINPSYIFYKDSQDIQRADMTRSDYVIGKAGVEHTGSYHCSVQSWGGKVKKNSTNVHILVQDPVSGVNITVDKDEKDFVHGEPLTLNCSAEKGTSPVFRWLHNETVVDKDSEFYQLRNNGTILYIESLQSHHIGTYKCNVSNRLQASSVKTFLINEILENQSLGSSIVWAVLGILALILLFAVILMFINRDKLSSLFPLLNRHHKQQNSESTFHTDNPRNEGIPATEGTNKPDEIECNQHLYGNVLSQPEENDVCYSYIDIRKKKGSANQKDELSVVYAVLQPPGTSTKTQSTPEGDDSADVYQNLDTKRH